MQKIPTWKMEGWLYKYGNYIRRYRRRWFVYAGGVLSYYKNKEEMGRHCKGTMFLHEANIKIKSPVEFRVDDGRHNYRLRAESEDEQKAWITLLEKAKGDDIRQGGALGLGYSVASVDIEKLISEAEKLQSVIKEMQGLNKNMVVVVDQLASSIVAENEKISMLQKDCSLMTENLTAAAQGAEYAFSETSKCLKILSHERGQRANLERLLGRIALENTRMSHLAQGGQINDELLDEVSLDEDSISDITVKTFEDAVNLQSDVASGSSQASTRRRHSYGVRHPRRPNKDRRRTRVPDKPNLSLNLWSFLRNCIGMDLSRIPLPVHFSEPLSMLQRIAEDYEYTYLLDTAANITDSCHQLAYVAVFAVTTYGNTDVRLTKPFNPMLGETYECDRMDDYGWRLIAEQTSHHPPGMALFCEGRGWNCIQNFTIASKFRGNNLRVIPQGVICLTFDASGNYYSWNKVTCVVNNIIVGSLFIENIGDMEVTNHKTNEKCILQFMATSMFQRHSFRKVVGTVMNSVGKEKWLLQGHWNNAMEIGVVTTYAQGKPVAERYNTIWQKKAVNPNAEKCYYFGEFAAQLNEPEVDVAPTDSRNRPDQRLMEEGKWDDANAEKTRLENKQRVKCKKLEEQATVSTSGPYQPAWFYKSQDPITQDEMYKFGGEYWRCKEVQDWSRCPDIF